MSPPIEAASGIGQFLQREYKLDVLRIGAAGQLARDGKLNVLPAEDQVADARANPVDQGSIRFDEHANEEHEDAIVNNLLAGPPARR